MLSQYLPKYTATGPDDIHYQMLKHRPESALDTLLHIFHGIWTTGVFQKAGVLPQLYLFPNQGKTMQNQQTIDQ